MRVPAFFLLLSLSAALGASGSLAAGGEPIDAQLARIRAEAEAAEQAALRLDKRASAAQGEAARLQAEQAGLAEAIRAAEARITAHQLEARLLAARLAAGRRELEQEQRPVSALLGGIATMAGHPPLLALASRNGTDELVEARILLATTMPVIRARSSRLSGRLAELARLRDEIAHSSQRLAQQRAALANRQQRFAMLEQRYRLLATQTGGAALAAGDLALLGRDTADRAAGELERDRQARRAGRELLAAGPALLPPTAPAAQPPLAYTLPADASVTQGLGEISSAGIRSRGVTLATRRGQPVLAPAAGTVRFSGPFRSYDGIVIIDHGGGWLSLLINVGSTVERGTAVSAGERLGQALGAITVELSRNGQHWSPALIAGSSEMLSKKRNHG